MGASIEDHTAQHCRQAQAFWKPALADRDGLEGWMQGGKQDTIARARQRWHELLQEHEDPELDPFIQRQLHVYLEKHTPSRQGAM